jgi:hypothetical protein
VITEAAARAKRALRSGAVRYRERVTPESGAANVRNRVAMPAPGEATICDSVEPPKKIREMLYQYPQLQLMCEIVTNFIKVFHRMPETFRHCVFTYECTDKIQPHRERDASGFKRIRVF